MSDPGPASTTATAHTVPLPDASAPGSESGSGAPTQAPAAGAPGGGRGRAVAAAVCVVLAALLMTPAAIAYWGHRTLTDAQRYVETVGPLVERPEVQDAVATAVVEAIDEQVDVEALVDEVLGDVIADRPRLQRLAGPLDAAVTSLVDRQVRELLASDAFADLWVTMNTRAQQALVRVLEGREGGAVQLEGDEVVLDLDEVITQVQERLVDRGLTILEDAPIPEVDRQIVLLDAPQLRQARTIYAFANPVAQWLIVVVIALFVAALLLARRRPRMTVVIGFVLVANALLVALALSVGRQLFVNALAESDFGRASEAFYDVLLTYLDRGWRVVFWIGVVLVAVGWYLSATRSATAVRGAVAGALETAGGSLAGGPTPSQVTTASRWVAANAGWLRVAIALLATVVLLWGLELSTTRLLWSLVLAVVLLAVVQVLVGMGRTVPRGPVAPAVPAA